MISMINWGWVTSKIPKLKSSQCCDPPNQVDSEFYDRWAALKGQKGLSWQEFNYHLEGEFLTQNSS